MFQTVVVPLDGSAFAECALPLALSIARRSGAALRLIRVAPTLGDVFFWAPLPGSPVANEIHDHFRADSMAYLESVGRRLKEAGAQAVTYSVAEGEVAEAIRINVARNGADLVVMSSHGRGALGRIWLGSVADELVRSLEVPLLLTRPEENPTNKKLEDAWAARRFVLAVDGSRLAERMLSPALALGRMMGAQYTLVRIVGVPGATQLAPHLSAELKNIGERIFHEAEDYLTQVADRLRANGESVETRVLFAEHPADGILKQAAEGADLIALATHGRHGLSRLLMGSVADKVVRGSSVPVFVCRGT
jgi:nucleotide-binding universal stress UspA family protein